MSSFHAHFTCAFFPFSFILNSYAIIIKTLAHQEIHVIVAPKNTLKIFLIDKFFCMIIATAISKSSCVTCTLRSLSAYISASVHTPFTSAPLAPASAQQSSSGSPCESSSSYSGSFLHFEVPSWRIFFVSSHHGRICLQDILLFEVIDHDF